MLDLIQVGKDYPFIIELSTGDICKGKAFVADNVLMSGGTWSHGISHIIADLPEDCEYMLEVMCDRLNEDDTFTGSFDDGTQFKIVV